MKNEDIRGLDVKGKEKLGELKVTLEDIYNKTQRIEVLFKDLQAEGVQFDAPGFSLDDALEGFRSNLGQLADRVQAKSGNSY